MTHASGTSPTLGDHARELLRPAVIVVPDTPLRTVANTLWAESVGAAVMRRSASQLSDQAHDVCVDCAANGAT
jgi:hypothetical protein